MRKALIAIESRHCLVSRNDKSDASGRVRYRYNTSRLRLGEMSICFGGFCMCITRVVGAYAVFAFYPNLFSMLALTARSYVQQFIAAQ